MKLTNIEIKGFKSFADKTSINFNDRITGVVGPNGCGKSNIVDAVRWVIGEQKASSLRSAKMENLIFAGSKKRKSSSLAEVALTFENTKNLLSTDYSTVKISRHYYRNGDSEYRLNGVACRLKDITNLFVDSGISSDSYAIMELGMINDILNDKDNSRRKLFEQAAGISKYKKRKKETLNKLKATEGDLDRVKDLLFEIEGNLKDLEKQAKRAERLKKYKNEYRELSIEYATLMLGGQKDVYQELHDQEAAQSDKIRALETNAKELEAQLEKEKSGNIEMEEKLAAAQKSLNSQLSALQKMESEKNLIVQGREYAENRKAELENQIEGAQLQVKELEANLELDSQSAGQLQSETDTQAEQLQRTESEREEAQQKLEKAREALEQQTKASQSKEAEAYELEKEIAINKTQLAGYLANVEQSKEEEASYRKELENTRQELQEAKRAKEKAEAEFNSEQARANQIKKHIDELSQQHEQISANLGEKNRRLDSKRNEYNLTKSLVDNLEGFPESIKFLRKEVALTKSAPLLSEVISCREDYKIAIENFLNPYLNHYIVKNFEEAVLAVEALSNAAKGRAQFFVLEELTNFQVTPDLSIPNALPAVSVLDIDEKYKGLAHYLLGNVYLVDDTQNFESRKLREFQKEGITLITKSGRFTRSKHKLAGGSVGLFEGKKLGRKKNLEKLSKEIQILEKESSSLNARAETLQNELANIKSKVNEDELESLLSSFTQKNNCFVSLDSKLMQLESYLGGSSDKASNIETSIARIQEGSQNLELALNTKKEEVFAQQVKLEEVKGDFNQKEETLRELNIQHNSETLQLHDLQNQFKQKEQGIQYKTNQLVSLRQQMENNREQIERLSQDIAEKATTIIQTQEEIEGGYTERDKREENLKSVETEYYQSRGSIHEIEENLRQVQRQRHQAEQLVNEVKDRFTGLKLELSSLKERLMIEFQVELDDLMDKDAKGEMPKAELEQKVEKLRNRINNYGEVNFTAMEAFEVMKKRYDFISGQKTDLDQAKDSLMETIKEIEETATEKFLKAFEEIRENFTRVFRGLFSADDTCDLKLLDPSDPLESKIEITAKPKGKRPQTINQLSGGEKTLTAMSLLFAIYLLKPAPFCILDEVDAPLDDNNIGKFNDIIRDFAKESQFIIVTHNKQTMSAVDVVYGVTMAEEGVSKVVPVDFRNLN